MKRILLCLSLAVFCHAAGAQWDMLGRNENLRLYIDRTPVQRQGDVATVWQMIDYTSAQWVGASVVMSVRNLVEYDCKARRARTIGVVAYSEQLGAGREVVSERLPNAEWADIPAASTGENLWKIACRIE